jgi:hypothetical protein
MRVRKFSHPRQIRLYSSQEIALRELFKDREYCQSKGFYNASDFIRNALNSHLREYEMHTFRSSVS